MNATAKTAVLVHGAWADPASWADVVEALRSKHIDTVTVSLPLLTLAGDVAALDDVLDRIPGRVILVGHAYAGAVIAATQSPKVAALVYIAGLAPDEGETVADVFNRYPHDDATPALAPGQDGLMWLPTEAFATAFAQHATKQQQQVLAASQRPISPAAITVPVGRPLWKQVPSWYLVAQRDHMIPEKTQRFMAERMHAHATALPVDHLPSVTAPSLVAEVIADAVRHTA